MRSQMIFRPTVKKMTANEKSPNNTLRIGPIRHNKNKLTEEVAITVATI